MNRYKFLYECENGVVGTIIVDAPCGFTAWEIFSEQTKNFDSPVIKADRVWYNKITN